jgi:hypothetical protein
MLRNILAMAAGTMTALALVAYVTTFARCGMDHCDGLREIPAELWMLIVLAAFLAGFTVAWLLRRR